MVLDAVHLLYQAGYDILPNNISPLRQGWSLPPRAMDGLPAPVSKLVNPEDSERAKVNNLEWVLCNMKKTPQNMATAQWSKGVTKPQNE